MMVEKVHYESCVIYCILNKPKEVSNLVEDIGCYHALLETLK